MDLLGQKIKLQEALEYLISTKEYKDRNGKDEVYQTKKRIAWKKAKLALKDCK